MEDGYENGPFTSMIFVFSTNDEFLRHVELPEGYGDRMGIYPLVN